MSERRGQGEVPDDQVIVLFGATGDLAKRKLLPQLAALGFKPGNRGSPRVDFSRMSCWNSTEP